MNHGTSNDSETGSEGCPPEPFPGKSSRPRLLDSGSTQETAGDSCFIMYPELTTAPFDFSSSLVSEGAIL